MSYALGSRAFKLPEDVAGMVALGREQVIRHLYKPENTQVDPSAPTNPQNHLDMFRRGLGLVDMLQVRIAEGEILGNRRQSFGLMVMAASAFHAWADYFQKNGHTAATMQLGAKQTQFEKITSGTLLGSVTALIDRTVQAPAIKGSGPRTVPFILTAREAPQATIVKQELEKMADFPPGAWFLQLTGKRKRTTQRQTQPRI